MKRLLNETLKILIFYSLGLLLLSIPMYYYLVDKIWLDELDEHNLIIANRTEYELKKTVISHDKFDEVINIWNKIQPGTNLKKTILQVTPNDKIYTIYRHNTYSGYDDINRFRGISRVLNISGYNYELTVETNVEETEETIAFIALGTLVFFIVLTTGFLLITNGLSNRLWKPFRKTLIELQNFRLEKQTLITFNDSPIYEFNELNTAIKQMMEKSISVYRSQKEFTENASHELQTPLSIIKNKLDLILQSDSLSIMQYKLIEDANHALSRISKLNKNLLLLAKIDNNQFLNKHNIVVDNLVSECLNQLNHHFEAKKMKVQSHLSPNTIILSNYMLMEMLINNLLTNTIRHSMDKSIVYVFLRSKSLKIMNQGSVRLGEDIMFQRFAKNRIESTGSGLGLAMIKEICSKSGWKINYDFIDYNHVFLIEF